MSLRHFQIGRIFYLQDNLQILFPPSCVVFNFARLAYLLYASLVKLKAALLDEKILMQLKLIHEQEETFSAVSRLTWTDVQIVQSVVNNSSTKLYNQAAVQGTRVCRKFFLPG